MRIFLFVLNGLGVGSLPDYSKYEKDYYCTAKSLECIDDLSTFCKLGLKKCCLDVTNDSTIGYFFRGRMLTTITTFESGLNEILGNIAFDEHYKVNENLLSLVKKHNVEVAFISSRKGSFADVVLDNDCRAIEYIQKLQSQKDSLFVVELNDFAKFGLAGDVENMANSIKMYDEFFGAFIPTLKYNDVLFISGNFGINPTKIGISREYNPIFVYSKIASGNKNLRTIQGNNAIAMTIADLLKIYPNSDSFVDDKLRQKIDNYQSVLKNEILASSIEKIMEFSAKTFEDKKLSPDGVGGKVVTKQRKNIRKTKK